MHKLLETNLIGNLEIYPIQLTNWTHTHKKIMTKKKSAKITKGSIISQIQFDSWITFIIWFFFLNSML